MNTLGEVYVVLSRKFEGRVEDIPEDVGCETWHQIDYNLTPASLFKNGLERLWMSRPSNNEKSLGP